MTKVVCLLVGLLALGLGFARADLSYNEKCDEAKNVTVTVANADGSNSTSTTIHNDNCNAKLFLKCISERCKCANTKYGVWTNKQVKVADRSKRSPGKGSKGGKSKGVSKGTAIAGAVVAGGTGYIVGSAIAGNSGHHSSGSGSSSSSSKSKDKYTSVYSCYSLVEGDCVIDPRKTTKVVQTTIVNGTSVTSTSYTDYKDQSECIAGAECVAKRVPGPDDNIGHCLCKNGYGKTNSDMCVKLSKNGAGVIGISTCTLFMITGALLFRPSA